MALNRIFRETALKNRARVVPSGTVSGDPLLINSRPAVALTDRGDATRSFTIPGSGVTLSGVPSGGASLLPTEASLAFDGTFEFEVTGAGSTAPAQDSVVYITSGNALTTTASGNTRYGTVDYPEDYHYSAGRLPVRIGG